MQGEMDHFDTDEAKNAKDNLTRITTNTARALSRQGALFKTVTANVCKGYVQANIVMLPSKYSKNFAEFCRINSGPLPVLFASERGQFDAPTLTRSTPSDIRNDLGAYAVIENAKYSRTVPNLDEYAEELKDFCFYYLGSSVSFNDRLLSAGIPLRYYDENGDVANTSKYISNIKCNTVGEFECCQVVTMLPIPAELVQIAYEVTYPVHCVHGAPIHIGNPTIIGIEDLAKVDFGVPTTLKHGDVPVFWSCGLTGLEAIKTINIPLALTNWPGSMYTSDCLVSDGGEELQCPTNDRPRVVWLSREPPLASALSQTAEDTLRKLETICSDDPGKRNIAELVVSGDFITSALCLSHAESVAIITGFPAIVDEDFPFETDGPPGALALGMFLQSLGIDVTFILDLAAGHKAVFESLLQTLTSKGIIRKQFSLEVYPEPGCSPEDHTAALEFLTENGDITRPRFDHLVAIERPGMAVDGNYYTMRAKKITHLVTNNDVLFEVAKTIPKTFTTGVGDGGNELGMGKVHDKIKQHIPNGETIASKEPADFIITCGVSNWGGYGLCFALFALRSDPIHDRFRRRGIGFPLTVKERENLRASLPAKYQEETVLRALMEHDFKDMTNQVCMSVDGLDFNGVHVPKLNNMMECIDTES